MGVLKKELVRVAAIFFKLNLINKVNFKAIFLDKVECSDLPNKGLGAAVYLASSLINHSCVPNMYLVNYGSTAVYRAKRPIKKGEQLTENYHQMCDLSVPLKTRIFILDDFMKFKCRYSCQMDLFDLCRKNIIFKSKEKRVKNNFLLGVRLAARIGQQFLICLI